tara:strand:+ start:336 stop:539 length:204 start_codon:yes stop_codon:yes gene_type:complete
MILTTIFYTGENRSSPHEWDYQDTTSLSFDKWLDKHNKDRISEGNTEEYKEDFRYFEVDTKKYKEDK